ncbi:DUF6531 domain-containing protein [Streptomyces xiamenensis]
MGRGSDWSPVGMDSDPTPGDPERVEELADKLLAFADDVAEAQDKLRNLMGDGLLDSFVGETANAFGEQMEDVPPNLAKLHESHELAGEALAAYWPKLRQAQADADRALEDAVEAQSDLTSAESWLATAASSLETAQDEAEPPDEGEVRAEVRRALTDAENDHEDAQSAVTGAQGRLDAAKLLAQQAKEAREEAASLCVSDLRTASDAGIKNKRWWEKVVDWVADNWDTIVQVAQIIGTIVGIAALFIGGPLIAGILLAVALVALADTLVKYSKGEASLWDVGFAVLDVLPGGRLLGAGARTARTALTETASTVRGLAPGMRRMSRSTEVLVCRTDPIDMATGEVIMSARDVELPGVLPLLVERHHRSRVRTGRAFGPSWASTLDQRLVLRGNAVEFCSEDGMILRYPVPLEDPEYPVFPVEGPRWGLSWSGPGSPMTLHQPDTGRTLRFSHVPGRPGAELLLVSIADRNGYHIDFAHGEDGLPSRITHSGGYRIDVTTHEERVIALHLASDPARPLLLSYTYENGNLSGIHNSTGLPFLINYDSRRRITGWKDRNGDWYRYVFDTSGRCTATEGSDGKLSSSISYDADARRTTFTNSLGATTVFDFDDAYRLIAETAPDGGVTRYTNDRYGRPLRVVDPLGRITEYSYDEIGNLLVVSQPDGTSVSTEYNEMSLPVLVTGADGAQWKHSYDEAGNLTSVIDPSGAESRWEFDSQGRLSRVVDEIGNSTFIECDSHGLPLVSTTASGAMTRYRRDSMGRPVEIVDPEGGRSLIEWDIEGHMTGRTDPEGRSQTWEWDSEGNLIRHVNAARAATEFAFSFDRMTRRREPDGTVHDFEHDTELNLVRVMNPDGAEWTYDYDGKGILTAERDYDGRTIRYGHNLAGELTSMTNALGETITYTRDPLGRVIGKTVGTETTSFIRDACGRLVRAAGHDTDLAIERDALGRVTAETSGNRTVRVGLDALGRQIRRTTPSGTVTSWEHDPQGRYRRLTIDGNTTLGFDLDRNDREVQRQAGQRVVLTQTWSPAGSLASQTVPTAGRTRNFTYHADDTLSLIQESDGTALRYTTDIGGRVTRVRGDRRSEEYTYDALGAVQSGHWDGEGTEPLAVDGRTRSATRLLQAGRCTYQYDAAGRVVARHSRTLSGQRRAVHFVWDAEDQLRIVVLPDGSRWTYRYDPLGRRTEKVHTSTEGDELRRIRITWIGSQIAEQSDKPANASAESILTWEWEESFGTPVAQISRQCVVGEEDGDSTVLSFVTDIAGTPVMLLDSSGNIAREPKRSLWGVDYSFDDETLSPDFPLGFPGQYRDEESGLSYNHFRYYDPTISRYYSPDPLGLSAAPHPYAYVSNPLLWIDPYGLACTIVRHFTSRTSYNQIMSGGGKGQIAFKASTPGKGHPHGVYVTTMSPADIAKKKGGFKSYLGITREKSEYMIEFKVDGDNLNRIRGDRGDHVQYIPNDLTVPRDNITYHGPTSNWSATT